MDLTGPPSLATTAHGRTRKSRFNARPVTGRKYHYNPLPVIAFGTDAPHRLIHEPGNLPSFFCGVKKFPEFQSCGLPAPADNRGEVSGMLHMRFSRCQRVDRKSPSLYMPKSEGAYNRKFLNFHHFFDFVIEFPEPLADRLLGNAINLTEFLLGKLLTMSKPEQLLVFRIQ